MARAFGKLAAVVAIGSSVAACLPHFGLGITIAPNVDLVATVTTKRGVQTIDAFGDTVGVLSSQGKPVVVALDHHGHLLVHTNPLVADETHAVAGATPGSAASALGDLDGDGDLDLVLETLGELDVFENRGGTLTSIALQHPIDVEGGRIAMFDVGGTGKLKALVPTAGEIPGNVLIVSILDGEAVIEQHSLRPHIDGFDYCGAGFITVGRQLFMLADNFCDPNPADGSILPPHTRLLALDDQLQTTSSIELDEFAPRMFVDGTAIDLTGLGKTFRVETAGGLQAPVEILPADVFGVADIDGDGKAGFVVRAGDALSSDDLVEVRVPAKSLDAFVGDVDGDGIDDVVSTTELLDGQAAREPF